MTDEMAELMDEYEERFGELFPLMCTKGMGERATADAIRRCLDAGEPYKLKDDVDY